MAKIAIFEHNESYLNELKTQFELTEGFSVCTVALSGSEALQSLKDNAPDVAIIDTTLKDMDGITLLDKINSEYPNCMSIMVSEFNNQKLLNIASNHGAIYFIPKPESPQNVVERVKDFLSNHADTYKIKPELPQKRNSVSIDEKISTIFTTIGIPPHIKGYSYLREGIKMAVNDPRIINRVTKELYPQIAEKFETTSSKVERAIRHAIEVAWNRGRTDAISLVFGARVYIGNERPTNSEFIALVADKLLLENLL